MDYRDYLHHCGNIALRVTLFWRKPVLVGRLVAARLHHAGNTDDRCPTPEYETSLQDKEVELIIR